MSSDQAAGDDGDLEPVTFIRMRAEDTFDGQERVMSKAAYDLQCRVTSHSASCGHPGYVPDDYLEHLNGLGIETTITAVELCAIGTWERAGGGYRILDWEAVEYALDWVRQRSGEDPQARAEERDHEASIWACMAKPIMVTPPCAACGSPAARIVLVAPGQLPPYGTSGPAQCKPALSGDATQDSGICCSKASPPTTGTATPSTPAGPGGSPRRSGIPSASPRSTRPGSTTMPGSARTATPPTATSTGTCPSRGTAIVPAATARAWTRTGNPTPRARRCVGVQLERKRW
jgi:hypothetical protein